MTEFLMALTIYWVIGIILAICIFIVSVIAGRQTGDTTYLLRIVVWILIWPVMLTLLFKAFNK